MEQQVSGEEFRQMSVSSKRTSPPKKYSVKIPVAWLAIVIVVGILCFVVGDNYGKDHATKTTSAAATSSKFGGGGFGGASRGLRAFGTVSSISATSITIQNQRTGSNDTYNITSSTQITDNGQTVTYTDIQSGDTVMITLSSSSSSNATTILVNPSFGGGFGGGSAPSGASSN